MTTPQEFCRLRIAALQTVPSYVKVLAYGTAQNGTVGVVQIETDDGENFIIQRGVGSEAAMTISGDCQPDGYVEDVQSITARAKDTAKLRGLKVRTIFPNGEVHESFWRDEESRDDFMRRARLNGGAPGIVRI